MAEIIAAMTVENWIKEFSVSYKFKSGDLVAHLALYDETQIDKIINFARNNQKLKELAYLASLEKDIRLFPKIDALTETLEEFEYNHIISGFSENITYKTPSSATALGNLI